MNNKIVKYNLILILVALIGCGQSKNSNNENKIQQLILADTNNFSVSQKKNDLILLNSRNLTVTDSSIIYLEQQIQAYKNTGEFKPIMEIEMAKKAKTILLGHCSIEEKIHLLFTLMDRLDFNIKELRNTLRAVSNDLDPKLAIPIFLGHYCENEYKEITNNYNIEELKEDISNRDVYDFYSWLEKCLKSKEYTITDVQVLLEMKIQNLVEYHFNLNHLDTLPKK